MVLDTGRFEVAKEDRNIAMCIGLQPCKIAKLRPQKVDTCGVAELKGKVIILKMIQIPESLFVELMKYHVLGIEDSLPKIQKGLEQKYEAMMRRELYTKSKTAKTQTEREEARKAYLDKVGMHRDFRW